GYNADSDGTCLASGVITDRPLVDAALGSLGSHGGPTQDHLPAGWSPLVDAVPPGTNSCGTNLNALDQRTGARPVDADGDGIAACDIGAVEITPAEATQAGLLVNHGGDAVDSSPGN